MSKLRKSIATGLLIVVAGCFVSLNVQAAEGMGMGMKGNMPTFADFDLDGDGKIVEQEFNTGHAKRMSEMAAEGRQMKHVGDAPGFTGIDTNDDGEISKQEFATHQAEHHKQMHESKHQSEQGKSK